MLHQEEPVEVPPSELENYPVGRLVGRPLLLISLDLLIDPPRTDAAVCQVRSQLCAVVCSKHSIPRVEVLCHQVAVPEVVLQAALGRTLAAFQHEGAPRFCRWLFHALAVRQCAPVGHVGLRSLPRSVREWHRPPLRSRQRSTDLAPLLHPILEWRERVGKVPKVSAERQVAQVVQGVPPHLAQFGALFAECRAHRCVDTQLLTCTLCLCQNYSSLGSGGEAFEELWEFLLRPAHLHEQVRIHQLTKSRLEVS
mmetsp:Transcript_102058/g.284104  ORF Transcript_102058/g.284104 Transcript_102058/m.284104 type:complete len:253 (-) Transcript_102058:266-1024(-)